MKISVVIPVRNEAESIGQLLDDLLKQSHQPDEILITDGGSGDATPLIVEEYAQRNPTVRLFRESNALPGRGRNIGAGSASHEWLAFIDAGVSPSTDWLAKLTACAAEHPDAKVIYGAWEPVVDTFFKECAAIAYAYLPTAEVDERFTSSRAILSSLVHRSVWQALGGFAEHLRSAEDLLFLNKIDEGGFGVAYAPHARVRWSMQPTMWRTFKRFVVYSRNNLRAGLGREWQAAILTRYALLLIAAVVSWSFSSWWPIITGALLLLMLGIRSLAALWRNRQSFPAGPVRNFRRLLLLVPLLITLDAATMIGTIDWLVRDKLRASGSLVGEKL